MENRQFGSRSRGLMSLLFLSLGASALGCGDDGATVTGATTGGAGGSAGSSTTAGTGTAGANVSGSAGSATTAGTGSGGTSSNTGGAGTANGGMGGGGNGGGAPGGTGGGGNAKLVWPNETSFANSDPWLKEHHTEIREMHPRFLVLDYANTYTFDQVEKRFQQQRNAFMVGSTYHGYSDPNAKPFMYYELAKHVDLRDNSGAKNSAKMPRRETSPGRNTINFSALFTKEYADLIGVKDPADASRNLTLCEAFQKGIFNDIFIAFTKDPPDDDVPEVIENKQKYDLKDVKKPGQFDRNAGNGAMSDEDYAAMTACGLSIRIDFLEMDGAFGNALQVSGHNFEHIGNRAVLHFDEMFKPFANFDLNKRFGTPFQDWYGECTGKGDKGCLTYPDQNSVTWGGTNTINPFNQACGNAHFPPNARGEYDQQNTQVVLSTCEHYGLHDGPGGKDIQTPYSAATIDKWNTDEYGGRGVAGGAWYIYWWQSWPGLDNKATMPDGTPMKNWWVYLYY
jgi:hypothetical protein